MYHIWNKALLICLKYENILYVFLALQLADGQSNASLTYTCQNAEVIDHQG